MIRTKRYGGFLVGDRVRVRQYISTLEGKVVLLKDGKCLVEMVDGVGQVFRLYFYPKDLINLTRLETDEIPKFPRLSDGLMEEIKARTKEYIKILEQPIPFVDLTTGTIEEREEKLRRLAEQKLCKEYGVEYPIVDNPALKASKENITRVSEETANELNRKFEKINKHINGAWNFMRPYPYNKNYSSTADY